MLFHKLKSKLQSHSLSPNTSPLETSTSTNEISNHHGYLHRMIPNPQKTLEYTLKIAKKNSLDKYPKAILPKIKTNEPAIITRADLTERFPVDRHHHKKEFIKNDHKIENYLGNNLAVNEGLQRKKSRISNYSQNTLATNNTSGILNNFTLVVDTDINILDNTNRIPVQ